MDEGGRNIRQGEREGGDRQRMRERASEVLRQRERGSVRYRGL